MMTACWISSSGSRFGPLYYLPLLLISVSDVSPFDLMNTLDVCLKPKHNIPPEHCCSLRNNRLSHNAVVRLISSTCLYTPRGRLRADSEWGW
ncbi:hypothetical protein F4782DRAFT_510017 [Xylaria castorea]|nr:hypothetical protein F4782DRAFT_510017 [Xylaria castorea]